MKEEKIGIISTREVVGSSPMGDMEVHIMEVHIKELTRTILRLLEENKELREVVNSTYTELEILSDLEFLKAFWKPESITIFPHNKGIQVKSEDIVSLELYEKLSNSDQAEFIKFIINQITGFSTKEIL